MSHHNRRYNYKLNFLVSVLFFVVLAIITFRCTWPADHVFMASDLNIGRLAFMKGLLPEYFTGYFSANQLFGSTGANYSMFNMFLFVLPLTVFANSFYGIMLVVGSVSMVWYLRILNRSWLALMTFNILLKNLVSYNTGAYGKIASCP